MSWIILKKIFWSIPISLPPPPWILNGSPLSALVQTVATVQVLSKAWINRSKPITLNSESKMMLPLGPDNLENSKNLLFKISQLGLNDAKLVKLAPVKDEVSGLVLTSGRLGSDSDINFRVPIIPSDHLAKLIALHCHNRGHTGVDGTMVKLRNRAWVLQGRTMVKAIVYRCIICRKIRKNRLNQVMADIPDFRATPNPPFSYCAVDLFGPILVIGGGG